MTMAFTVEWSRKRTDVFESNIRTNSGWIFFLHAAMIIMVELASRFPIAISAAGSPAIQSLMRIGSRTHPAASS